MWRWLRAEVQSEAARERKEKTRRMKKEKSVRKLVQEKRRCCRGAEQLSVHVWVCVHGAPARVWLGAFKARGCVCVCVCAQASKWKPENKQGESVFFSLFQIIAEKQRWDCCSCSSAAFQLLFHPIIGYSPHYPPPQPPLWLFYLTFIHLLMFCWIHLGGI